MVKRWATYSNLHMMLDVAFCHKEQIITTKELPFLGSFLAFTSLIERTIAIKIAKYESKSKLISESMWPSKYR